jgi:hypothetical protein
MVTIPPKKIHNTGFRGKWRKWIPSYRLQKTKINDTKVVHKNNLKEDILQVITENFVEMILDMVNQNVQEALKKFQGTKNKEYKKTQEQINEIIEP